MFDDHNDSLRLFYLRSFEFFARKQVSKFHEKTIHYDSKYFGCFLSAPLIFYFCITTMISLRPLNSWSALYKRWIKSIQDFFLIHLSVWKEIIFHLSKAWLSAFQKWPVQVQSSNSQTNQSPDLNPRRLKFWYLNTFMVK